MDKPQNPYPEFVPDEASGEKVEGNWHIIWQEGADARAPEINELTKRVEYWREKCYNNTMSAKKSGYDDAKLEFKTLAEGARERIAKRLAFQTLCEGSTNIFPNEEGCWNWVISNGYRLEYLDEADQILLIVGALVEEGIAKAKEEGFLNALDTIPESTAIAIREARKDGTKEVLNSLKMINSESPDVKDFELRVLDLMAELEVKLREVK